MYLVQPERNEFDGLPCYIRLKIDDEPLVAVSTVEGRASLPRRPVAACADIAGLNVPSAPPEQFVDG